jgi:hypothetical protein
MLRADGRMDITKLIVAFRNFATAPKRLNFVESTERMRKKDYIRAHEHGNFSTRKEVIYLLIILHYTLNIR